MNARRKTSIRLSEDVRKGFARVAAKPTFEAEPAGDQAPFTGRSPGTPTKRDIPADHSFDKKAVKPLVKTLWAMSVALGHALTAHREFSRLKSSTFSPDGLLGGRGYVTSIKDVRANLFEACEQLSTLCDTLHDEINAPHWKPKIAELEKMDLDEVSKLLGDAEDWIDDPEGEAEDEIQGVEKKPWSKADKKRFKKEHGFGSGLPSAGDKETLPSQGPHPAGSEHPFNNQMRQASMRGPCTGSYFDPSVLGITADELRDMDEEEKLETAQTCLHRAADLSTAIVSAFRPILSTSDTRTIQQAAGMLQSVGRRIVVANSSLAPQTEPGGPRVQHLDRADTDQTGPSGSYNRDEAPVSDAWGEDGGVSGEPMSQDSGDDYSYPSDWSGDLSGKSAASGVPDANTDRIETTGWDFGVGDGNGNDAHGQGAGGYGEGNPSSGGKGVYGPRADLPDDPGGKTKDDESDSNPVIEKSVSESGHMGLPVNASRQIVTWVTLEAAGKLPNDLDDPVARSDYFVGPKGNDFNGQIRGNSGLPGENPPQKETPVKPRPSHLGEHEFAAAGELPGDDAHLYDYGRGAGPNVMDRTEHGDQPYVKWDDTTHNMRPDYTYQRDPIQGPYPRQGI